MSKADNYIHKAGVQDFIMAHENDDVQKLLLKQKEVLNVPMEWIARQLSGRSKAKFKLPTWYRTPGIVFPPAISLEQASSEATARFKSALLQRATDADKHEKFLTGADLAAGLGIDSYYFSLLPAHVDYADPQVDLVETARHNHLILGAANITHHCTTAEEFLSTTGQLDFIYLDPSRRKSSHKVFRLADCQPDVTKLLDKLFEKTPTILIKSSPLLDLQLGFRELRQVARIVVVAVENECKEVLFLLQQGAAGDPVIEAVHLSGAGEVRDSCSFTWSEEKNCTIDFSLPLTFLYEPNAAILKSGAFKWIAQHCGVQKLSANTHLYTTADKKDFPGRIFRILEHVKLDKRLRDRFENGYVNIIARNYPLRVEEIRKKTGLKEGGSQYLIAAQSEKDKHVMIVERVQ